MYAVSFLLYTQNEVPVTRKSGHPGACGFHAGDEQTFSGTGQDYHGEDCTCLQCQFGDVALRGSKDAALLYGTNSDEVMQIADALDVKFEQSFTLPDGEKFRIGN